MKQIKIAFLDFWSDFDYRIMNFYNILCERYEVIVENEAKKADYIFYSCFGSEHWSVPNTKIKIFYTAENITPDFNACDYAVAFDKLTYGDRFLRFSNAYSTIFAYDKVFKHIENRIIKKRSEFCGFVVSNGHGSEERTKLFQLLSKYKRVDSGGRYLNNIGGPVADKFEFDSKHKFSICCENSSQPGYTTEKIYQAFAAGTIPIYWGDPTITEIFNEKAFVRVGTDDSLEDIVSRVISIDTDDSLYESMLNEDIFVNAAFEKYENQINRLRCFLYNIFDQDFEKAKRYSRFNGGLAYQNKMAEVIRKSKMTTAHLLAIRFTEIFNALKTRLHFWQ